jgi:hypothetical protein
MAAERLYPRTKIGESVALIPMPMSARVISVGGRTVVERIMIDVSIPGIEAIITCIGAPVAPVRVLPHRPNMPATPHTVGPKVCRL